jgi:hypothetical protein
VDNPKKSKPWQLIAILAVTIVPIVGAYIAYYTGVGVPQEHVNEGELIAPAKNLTDILSQAEGNVPSFEKNYFWRLMIPVNGQCDRVCEQNLYVTRQVQTRLNDKSERFERYAVNIGGEEGEVFLNKIAADHPQLKHFSVDPQIWSDWLRETNVPQDINGQPYYLLVDQVGFAMMVYTAKHDGNQLLKDIKRVLRYSPEK